MTPRQQRAQQELAKMKARLAGWLTARRMMDEAAAGTRPARVSPYAVQQIIKAYRDTDTENRMAAELRALLSEVYDPGVVPLDDYDAVTLADIIVTGKLPKQAASAQPQGIIWMAPLMVLAVAGGIGWVLSSSIKGYAEIVEKRENAASCRAGIDAACPTNPWLKWIAIGGVGYILLGDRLKGLFGLVGAKAKRSRAGRWLES